MCQGMDYCLICEPTAEMEAWTQGNIHIMPVPGDNAQREAMTMHREIAFKKALQEGMAEAWPEYRDPSRSFDRIFTPEEASFVRGETNDLPTLAHLPFSERTRLQFIFGQRVKNALRKFRRGDGAVIQWREYQFACSELDRTTEAEARRIFSLIERLALIRPTTGLAARKHLSCSRRYRNRLLRLLGRFATKNFLVNAWREHFVLSRECPEQYSPESLAA